MFVSLSDGVDVSPEGSCTTTASSLDTPSPALGTGKWDWHAQSFAES